MCVHQGGTKNFMGSKHALWYLAVIWSLETEQSVDVGDLRMLYVHVYMTSVQCYKTFHSSNFSISICNSWHLTIILPNNCCVKGLFKGTNIFIFWGKFKQETCQMTYFFHLDCIYFLTSNFVSHNESFVQVLVLSSIIFLLSFNPFSHWVNFNGMMEVCTFLKFDPKVNAGNRRDLVTQISEFSGRLNK